MNFGLILNGATTRIETFGLQGNSSFIPVSRKYAACELIHVSSPTNSYLSGHWGRNESGQTTSNWNPAQFPQKFWDCAVPLLQVFSKQRSHPFPTWTFGRPPFILTHAYLTVHALNEEREEWRESHHSCLGHDRTSQSHCVPRSYIHCQHYIQLRPVQF
jgi:hypothetical protein